VSSYYVIATNATFSVSCYRTRNHASGLKNVQAYHLNYRTDLDIKFTINKHIKQSI